MSKEGIQINRLLNGQQMNGKVGLFAHVTIAPGAVLDDHTHHGETETYHILAGEGVYRDNGTDCPAKPGDTFFCEDGGTHGIRCVSQTPLEFMALIIKA